MKWRMAIPVIVAVLSVDAGLFLQAQVQPAATQEPQQESAAANVPGDPENLIEEAPIQDDSIISDDRALSGAVQPGLGSWGPRHSFWIPRLSFAQSLGSNPMLEDPGAYRGFTAAVGQAQAIQYFGRGGEVRYAGAVRFDSSATVYGANRMTNSHALGVSETIRLGAWDLSVIEQAHYWQGSPAGDSGMEGLGSVTTQLSDWAGAPGIQLDSMTLQSGIEPDQSILSVRSSRVSNTALGEVDRHFGARNVATAAGFYGSLHFLTSGLIDGTQAGILAGYDRVVSSRDRLGLMYGYTQLDFASGSNSFVTSYGQVLYGRSLSGRLAFEVGAGPQYLASAGGPGTNSDFNWQGRGSLSTQFRSASLRVAGMRMVTGGSGILYGALSNEVEVGAMRSFQRIYSAGFNFGVARSTAIQSKQGYDTRHFGASVARTPSGRLSTFLSYDLRSQDSFGCAAGACTMNGVWQTFGVGLTWTRRPIGLP